MKISFTTNVNTKKFSSVDELPPDVRAIYDRALANGLAGKSSVSTTGPKVSTRLVVNGHEVSSTEELSEAERKLYADVCQLLKDAPATTTDPAAMVTQSASADRVNLRDAAGRVKLPHAATDSEGWLTKKQWMLVLLVILSAAVALAIVLA